MATIITCPHCRQDLSLGVGGSSGELECSRCKSHLSFVIFSGYPRSVPLGRLAEPLTGSENEASCYNHVTRKAISGCENCGRLICSVCDLEVGGKHFCPTCATSQQVVAKCDPLIHRQFCPEKAVFILGFLSLYPFCGAILFSPPALYIANQNYSKRTSLDGGGRIWMISGIFLSLLSPILLVLCCGIYIFVILSVARLHH